MEACILHRWFHVRRKHQNHCYSPAFLFTALEMGWTSVAIEEQQDFASHVHCGTTLVMLMCAMWSATLLPIIKRARSCRLDFEKSVCQKKNGLELTHGLPQVPRVPGLRSRTFRTPLITWGTGMPRVDPTCPNAASSHPESKDPGIPPNPRAAHELSHSLPGDAKGIMIHWWSQRALNRKMKNVPCQG